MKRLARFLFVLLPISAIFVLVASTQSGKAANPATFSFIDVGQDDSALLSDGNNYNVLIDGAQPAAGADALYPDRHVDGAYARSYWFGQSSPGRGWRFGLANRNASSHVGQTVWFCHDAVTQRNTVAGADAFIYGNGWTYWNQPAQFHGSGIAASDANLFKLLPSPSNSSPLTPVASSAKRIRAAR